ALKGVSVQDLTPDLYHQLNIPGKINGVIITRINEGSPAQENLLPGDIIQEINRKAIANLQDFENIASKIKPDENILLLVFRKGTSLFISISP
ncbi:MAG: PDZ domain-containing protein, partial [Nitrospirae bacterium]|nr:PDZ domain-containing protein [Nitrospirota bacterium]